VGRRPDLQEEIQAASESEAGRHGGWEHQEACLVVLPDENWALPYRAVSPLDEEPAHPAVLVVPMSEADDKHLFKVCPEWKSQQEILWAEVLKETPVRNPGPPCRQEVQPGGIGLPLC